MALNKQDAKIVRRFALVLALVALPWGLVILGTWGAIGSGWL